MNGRLCVLLTLAVTALASSGPLYSEEPQELKSLRGAEPVAELAETAEPGSMQSTRTPIPREFEQQPPLIPHAIRAYRINLETNKCMNCHRDGGSGKEKAPLLSESHFTNRDGTKLEDVAGSRYFCTLCHVEQFDAAPLVENEFKPIEAMK